MDYSTEDYLTQLESDRSDFIDNLTTKGITGLTGDETFTELVPEVLNIPQPSGKIEITQNGTDIDVSNYATADVSVSGEKFAFISGGGFNFEMDDRTSIELQNEIDNIVANVDTSSIISTRHLLNACTNLTSIDLSSLDTSNVTNMSNCINGCSNLTSIDLSGWDTSKVTTIASFILSCPKLTSLDLKSFTSTNMIDGGINYLCFGCTTLSYLDMRNFDFTKFTTAQTNFGTVFGGQNYNVNCIPNNCEIIVKDATQKQWFTTNFSRLTNVKTVSEYEAEQVGE